MMFTDAPHRFLKEFSRRPPISSAEQIRIINDFLDFIAGKMRSFDPWKASLMENEGERGEAEFDMALEAMEKLVMNRLWHLSASSVSLSRHPLIHLDAEPSLPLSTCQRFRRMFHRRTTSNAITSSASVFDSSLGSSPVISISRFQKMSILLCFRQPNCSEQSISTNLHSRLAPLYDSRRMKRKRSRS